MTDVNKTADITRGLELAQAATPMPWYQQVDCSQLDENGNGPVGRCVSIYEDDICDAIAWMSDREDSSQNHAYIIEACNHYPAALKELAELRAEAVKNLQLVEELSRKCGEAEGRLIGVGWHGGVDKMLDAFRAESESLRQQLADVTAERDRLRDVRDEIGKRFRECISDRTRLLDWKESATSVMNATHVAWERCGKPGNVGESISDAMADEVLRLRAELNVARVGLMAVEDLIDESKGVYGLHLNGDPVPWSEIRGHGRLCEWLEDYDAAVLEAMAAMKEPQP